MVFWKHDLKVELMKINEVFCAFLNLMHDFSEIFLFQHNILTNKSHSEKLIDIIHSTFFCNVCPLHC